MNHIYRCSASVFRHSPYVFTENPYIKSSIEKNKILLISSIALAVIVAMSLVYQFCFSKNSKLTPNPNSKSSSDRSLQILKMASESMLNQDQKFKKPSEIDDLLKFTPFKAASPQLTLTNSFETGAEVPLRKQKSAPTQMPYQKNTKSVLAMAEGEINQLQEDLQLEYQMLDLYPPSKGKQNGANGQKNDDAMRCEIKIAKLEKTLEKALNAYPTNWCDYMKAKFSDKYKKNNQQIYEHIVVFSGFMEQNAGNNEFIYNCLKQINLFLTEACFTSDRELCLQEDKKVDFIVFHEFFSIVDWHFKFLEKKDPKLALDLKLKLANLPIRDEQSNLIDPQTGKKMPPLPVNRAKRFPNVHLTEKNQLEILTDYFQKEEDKFLAALISNLSSIHRLSKKDALRLSKMTAPGKSQLSQANMLNLQNALLKHMGIQPPLDWNHEEANLNALNAFFNQPTDQSNHQSGSNDSVEIANLRLSSAARNFFASQNGLSERQIQIPRWYYTTNNTNVEAIIQNGQIDMENHKEFEGVCVSSQIEPSEEDAVFALNPYIARLDSDVLTATENKRKKGNMRWRGLQSPIPLVDAVNDMTFLNLVGIDTNKPGTRLKLTKMLQNKGLMNVKVVSLDLLYYMQKAMIKIIGNPNLSEKWWGIADSSYLDKPLAKK